MQILSYFLEVLHVSAATDRHAILISHTGRQYSFAVNLSSGDFYKQLNEGEVVWRFLKTFLPKMLWSKQFYCQGNSHKHGTKFKEVIVLGVLHFNNSPGVKTTADLLPLHLNQLVGSNHSKRNACLRKKDKGQWIPREKHIQGKKM